MRLGIVNDVAMAREGLRRLVAPRHEVLWTAADGAEAVACCCARPPDLVLMDLIMPGMDGVAATREIMRRCPVPILVVTASVNANCDLVFQALGAGALDAVNTPVAGGGELLRKLDLLALLAAAPAPAPAVKAVSAPGVSGTPLVLLGASAGGPKALAAILARLPAGFPGAVLVVQHLDAEFTQGLAGWLDAQGPLPVALAREGELPRPGRVYLAGGGRHLVLAADGSLKYSELPDDTPYRPSVDVFFCSAARHAQGPVAAALLTGMGRDGAAGLAALRRAGALTLAQDAASAVVYGMPRAAVEAGAAAEVLPLDGMAERLLRWVEALGDEEQR